MPSYKNALLLDDDPIALMVCERMIRISHFAETCINFQNTAEALKFFAETPADSPSYPDILLIDLHMPFMDGFEFLQKINELGARNGHFPDVYVLSSTVYADDENRLNRFPFVKKIILKPLTPEHFDSDAASTHHQDIYAPL